MDWTNRLLAAALLASACWQTVRAEAPLRVVVDANSIWIEAGESPVLQYRYGDVPFKPYVKELCTPGGLNVLLDAPHDHLHHHGLMFAVAVDGVNFWEETPTAGRQVQRSPLATILQGKDQGGPGAGFCTGPSWTTATGSLVGLSEARTIKACRMGEPEATVVTWQSECRAIRPRAALTLSGSHYFGLGMRFVRSMDGGEFFNADGKEGTVFRGEERLVRSDWCAYAAAIEGKPVTVAMFDDPNNPRHPATWFTMAEPFAYLSATLRLHEEPLLVTFDRPLRLRYGVALWDGRPDSEAIETLYGRWVAGR